MNPEKITKNTAILYISGAGLDSAVWDSMRAKLMLPGAVITHARGDTVTLGSTVQEALNQIQEVDATRFIIVAHSLGGVIGVELARKLGDKLAGFIAVSATIPAPGESFIATLPFPQRIIMPIVFRLIGTKPPASMIRNGLCSDLDDAQAAAISAAFTPEPRSLYVNKTSKERLPTAKYLYVRTLRDKQFPVQLQSQMARQLPNAEITDIAAGHMSMVNHSDELATIINTFCRNIA